MSDQDLEVAEGGDLQPLGRDEGRRLIDEIKANLERFYERNRDGIIELYVRRAWIEQGYASWEDLCNAEFRVQFQLPKDERQRVVRQLTEAGMTTRPVAAVLNISHTTVVRDQHDSGGTNVPTRIGTDGKTYSRVPDVVEGVVLPTEAEEDADKIRRANVSSARQHSERLANEMRAAVSDLQLKSGNLADHLELIGSGMPELISLTDAIENGRRRLDAPLQDLGDATAEFGKVIKKAIKEPNLM